MLYNLKEPLSKQDMQEGYVLAGMHAVKSAVSPHISLYLSLYKITLMKKIIITIIIQIIN